MLITVRELRISSEDVKTFSNKEDLLGINLRDLTIGYFFRSIEFNAKSFKIFKFNFFDLIL